MSTTVSATPKRVRIPYTMTYIDCTCDATEKDDCTCIRAIPAEEKRRMRMEFRRLTPDQVEELLGTPVAAASTSCTYFCRCAAMSACTRSKMAMAASGVA